MWFEFILYFTISFNGIAWSSPRIEYNLFAYTSLLYSKLFSVFSDVGIWITLLFILTSDALSEFKIIFLSFDNSVL